ncbi:MAG: hypothetical protein QXQ41_01015 [Candidatus Bathyarchaeia archaeon]
MIAENHVNKTAIASLSKNLTTEYAINKAKSIIKWNGSLNLRRCIKYAITPPA